MDEKRDIYFASGWFSPEQEENYQKITSLFKSHNKTIFEPKYEAGEFNKGPLTLEKAKQIFNLDLKGIESCKTLFADISFRDTGVLVEIGYAIAKGIPVVLFDNSSRPSMNVMLAGAAQSAIRTFEEISDWLNGEEVFDIGGKELE